MVELIARPATVRRVIIVDHGVGKSGIYSVSDEDFVYVTVITIVSGSITKYSTWRDIF